MPARFLAKEYIKANDVILLTTEDNILVNSHHRSSTVIVQKPLCEGFGFAQKALFLFRNPKIADDIGKDGRETVKNKFLITRLLKDQIDLLGEALLA